MAEFLAAKFAEAVVSVAVQKITDLLLHEAASLRRVRDDVQYLQRELECTQGFLKHAEEKQEEDPRVKIWIEDVRDLACEIEDAIEIYIYKVRPSNLFKFFHLLKFWTQFNSIKDEIKSIGQRRQTYGIQFTGSHHSSGERAKLSSFRSTSPDYEEDDVITLKDTTTALKSQLMKVEDQRCIVSIVGMGGLGKTTLAKKVYNDVDVKKDFDCRAWIFISQQYIAKEVLIEVLVQVGFQYDTEEKDKDTEEKDKDTKESLKKTREKRKLLKDLGVHELVDLMKNELKDTRYLVVLDDIWSTDAWRDVSNAFPNGKPGSKVLFTTRNEEVAVFPYPHSLPIRPPLLTSAESWELLQRKVFGRDASSEGDCPSEFAELGKEVVEKCGGLPLAIVVLGGLLRTKSSPKEWEKVLKHVKSLVICQRGSDQRYSVEDILNLSFQDLPPYLKPCFLYLGIFPEDSEICKTKLIQLWIAEGFVTITEKEEAVGTRRREDLAEQYLGELVDRCIVQLSKVDHTGEGVKACRLHDIMRDFCISKAKQNNFLNVMKLHEMNKRLINSRRVAIYTDLGNLHHHAPWVEQVQRYLRSLVCHGLNTQQASFLSKKNFTRLRVLEFDFSNEAWYSSVTLPSEIGNLILLRYLKISGPHVYLKLPDCIVNLRNLHTLDLQGIRELYLPWIVFTMRSLRHLLLPVYPHGYKIIKQNRFARFAQHNTKRTENLETVKGIFGEDLIKYNAVISLANIRKLDIRVFGQLKHLILVLESLSTHVDCLQCLGMEIFDQCEFEFPSLELLSKCSKLARLHLGGKLSLENFSFLPETLIKLDLQRSRFNQEKLVILEKLPNLRILRIQDIGNKDKYKWVCSAGGFLKLEILTLTELGGLEEWEVEEGAMPILKILSIDRVQELRVIPGGLKYVTTLRELNIIKMKKAFADKLIANENGLGGEDFYKVCHIPSISISTKTFMSFQ